MEVGAGESRRVGAGGPGPLLSSDRNWGSVSSRRSCSARTAPHTQGSRSGRRSAMGKRSCSVARGAESRTTACCSAAGGGSVCGGRAVRAAAGPPAPTQLWPRARGPTPCSPPWLRILPAGQPAAREGVWWPGAAGQRAGPGPPAPHLPGSRPGPGPVLSDNGRQLGAGAGSEGEGAQVSEGCGVREGRMGRVPLERKLKGHRALPSCEEKSLGEEPSRGWGDLHRLLGADDHARLTETTQYLPPPALEAGRGLPR